MKPNEPKVTDHIKVVASLVNELHAQYLAYGDMVEDPIVPADSIESLLTQRLRHYDRIESLTTVLGIGIEWTPAKQLIFLSQGRRFEHFRDALAARFGASDFEDMEMRDRAAEALSMIEKFKAIWIKTDGTYGEAIPANGTDFNLEEMYKFIGTPDPLIDVTWMKGKNKTLVCHDNGIAMGLPTNVAASVYCKGHVGMESCGIVGDVLICNDEMVQ